MATINWATVAAILTSGTILLGGAAFVIRAIVRTEIRAELNELKGGFVTSDLANERHSDHGRRITSLERHVFGSGK